MNYLFASGRLGFRAWQPSDIDAMQEINSDELVMEFFPGLQTKEQTAALSLITTLITVNQSKLVRNE